ncbi:MAG: Nif3-like dinuclear metal center hexameric protein [Lentisphaerae bacterium]|nr:Nif3-like dinuclear metal center hexameric protein [Lentisphaerota bacterium]
MNIAEVARYYNDLLKISDFAADPSNNGLQVSNCEEKVCSKAAFAVDASLASIKRAAAENADILVVHHGLSWGGGIRRWNGVDGRRFAAMFKNDLSLYAMHLPLDAHSVYGNNACLGDLVKLDDREMFFPYHGMNIGVIGNVAESCVHAVAAAAAAGKEFKLYMSPLKADRVQKVAIISGGGGSDGLESAIEAGADMLITGEFDHTMYHMVQENKIHVAALGHYNSEVHGVQSLQKLAAEVLGLETVFIDIPTGL